MNQPLYKPLQPADDVMTVERLRQHLFGGPQVPFWNYDPNQITVGVEIEYFIAHIYDDGSFKLATKDEYLEVMEHLKNDFEYKDRNLLNQPGRVSKDTERGFIAIKPDFAWHILEISLPPRKDLNALKNLLDRTIFEVDACLAKANLTRLNLSCLPDVPQDAELVDLDRLRGHIDTLKNQDSVSIYSVPIFPALIVATHVHLNVLNEQTYRLIPELYATETVARERFSRVQNYRGQKSNNHREKFYQISLGPDYRLCDIPSPIPASIADYCALFNSSAKVFPNDKFFGARDLTAIRPTRYGTLEFRSSCSFLDSDKIMDIVRFRIKTFVEASEKIKSFTGKTHAAS
ncbi:MAG: hypothetical protein WCO71_08720 [Pseudomonadota bacterium]